MSLNQAQYEAVVHKDGPCLVLAGPGSGKTLTIVKRIEHLIQKQGVRPEEILVITFTKYASFEMKNRFFQSSQGKHPAVTFGTFHGIYYGVLKWAYGFGSQNLMSDEDKMQMLRQSARELELEMENVEDENDFMQEIAAEISLVKNNHWDIDTYEALKCPPETFRGIYKAYEKLRKQAKKIDFDDMLVLCYELFRTRPDILAKWQNRFPYILIDEFQDINQVQYDVIQMLASPGNNLFVVGDDDQSIYAFRGAKPEIMFQFKRDYPNAKELILNINYRSTSNITKNAGKVITNNRTRFPKALKSQKEEGATVHVQELNDSAEESEYVMNELNQYIKQGVKPEQIAVLFRTNVEARTIVETFLEHNVTFQMKEYMNNIYEHFIAQNIASYFRLAAGERQRRDFLGIMNRPNRYIGRDSVEETTVSFESLKNFYCDKSWMQDRIDQLELDLRVMKKMAPYAAIQYLRRRVGYDGFLREYSKHRRINQDELFETLAELEERAKAYATMEEWFAHVEAYSEALRQQYSRRNKEKKGVHLVTMHGAKGLEYEVVFVIKANEGVIPYKKAQMESEIEEERRLFYVAMTRAKERLVISYVKTKNGKDCDPSRFVNELLVGI